MLVKYNPANSLTDFRNFLKLVWKRIGLPKPTRRQLAIAWYMQYHPEPRRMVQAFRGAGKSWIAAAFADFCLYHRPELNILVLSKSKLKADQFSQFALRLIKDIPELKHMQPREDQRESAVAFDVAGAGASQTPSVVSLGISGQITGQRADLILPDDVETPDNSDTQVQREKLSERIKELDDILKPGGEIVGLGTPQNNQSVYNKLRARGFHTRIWPAIYPTQEQIDAYGNLLAPDILEDLAKNPALKGHTTELRFPDELLELRRLSHGESRFALQYMLDTRLADENRYPLKTNDLIIYSINPDEAPEKLIWARDPELVLNDLPNVGLDGDKFYRPVSVKDRVYRAYTGSVMFVDPAGRGKDETAAVVVKFLHGMLYVPEIGAFKGYDDPTMIGLAEMAKRNKVNKLLTEANFGDGMFTRLLMPHLQRIYPVAIEEVKVSVQKERRIIDTLEPVLNQHRLVIDPAVVKWDYESVKHLPTEEGFAYRLIYQMTHISRDKGGIPNDDRVDALAGAVGYWVEQMSRDVERAAQEAQERQHKQELQNWMQHVLGKGEFPKVEQWIKPRLSYLKGNRKSNLS